MSDTSSVQGAHARIDRHEAVCAYRWESVEKQLSTLHERLNAMSNRMWAAAGALIGLGVVALATMLLLYINMVKH